MSQPFIIEYPYQLLSLFWCGIIIDPNGIKWNISFCPGITGAWESFTKFWIFFSDALSFSLTGHINIIECIWDIVFNIEISLIDIIICIPKNIGESFKYIDSLVQNTPFGWIGRILITLIWSCLLWPILTFILSMSILILLPFIMISLIIIICGSKFILGLLSSIISAILSPFSLIISIIVSILVTLGALVNRFPKETDDKTYGLFIIQNNNEVKYGAV